MSARRALTWENKVDNDKEKSFYLHNLTNDWPYDSEIDHKQITKKQKY